MLLAGKTPKFRISRKVMSILESKFVWSKFIIKKSRICLTLINMILNLGNHNLKFRENKKQGVFI